MRDRGQSGGKEKPRRTRRRSAAVAALIAAGAAVAFLWATPVQAGSARVYSPEELAFVAQLNHYRVSNGQQALALSDTLSLAAERHSLDMALNSFISHTTDTTDSEWFQRGAYPWDRMRSCGYDYDTRMGENIGAGQSTADSVFEGFKASADHNTVMLYHELSAIGISLEEVSGSDCTYYWTADFGGHVDSSAYGFSVYEQDDPQVDYTGPWVDRAESSSSGGSHRYLDSAGRLTVRFTGTSLSWIAAKARDRGIAKVTLDGTVPAYVDLYSTRSQEQRCVYSTGTIPEGDHTLVIEWTGTQNPDATGSLLGVDAFDVQGSFTSPEAGTYLADLFMRNLRLAALNSEPAA